jgi:RNA polymerase sigma-70 factor, ECF subfamily
MLAEQRYPEQAADLFETLVDQYAGRMKAVGFRVLGDIQLAEDVVQETFLRAFVNRSSLDDDSNIGGWLYTIAYRVSIDYQRKRRRELLAYEEDLSLFHLETPEETLLAGEERHSVWSAVHSVDEKYRLPLILFYKYEWPLQRIADHLGLTVPALKSRLHRSRAMLRAKLGQLELAT